MSGSEWASMLIWSAPDGGDHRINIEADDDIWHVVKEYRHGKDGDWREDWRVAADPDTGVFANPLLKRALEERSRVE